jgi:hypothetical protein
MTVESISTAPLCLFDCISLSLHNIFDHGVTKSKQCYIKSMAQHEMLSYYRDCVFVFVKVELLHHRVLLAAHCV